MEQLDRIEMAIIEVKKDVRRLYDPEHGVVFKSQCQSYKLEEKLDTATLWKIIPLASAIGGLIVALFKWAIDK